MTQDAKPVRERATGSEIEPMTAPLTRSLTPEALAEMYAHARRDYPNECCGIVFGPQGRGHAGRAVACVNIQNELHAEDPEHARARRPHRLQPGRRRPVQAAEEPARRRAGEDHLPLARRRRRLLQRHRSGRRADGRRAQLPGRVRRHRRPRRRRARRRPVRLGRRPSASTSRSAATRVRLSAKLAPRIAGTVALRLRPTPSTLPSFLRACRGETTERAPLWMMRQAGRYLPEYREVRAKVSFLELCKTPKLAAEVTLQPIRRFGFDAAILFSDLLVPLEAMGLEVEFTDEGPRPAGARCARRPISAASRRFDPEARTGFVMETIRPCARSCPRDAAHRVRGRARSRSPPTPSRARPAKTLRRDEEVLLPPPGRGAAAAGPRSARRRATTCWPRSRPARRPSSSSTRGSACCRPRTSKTSCSPPTAALVAALRATGVPVIYFGNGADDDPRPGRAGGRRRLRRRLAAAPSTRRARGCGDARGRAGEPRSGPAARTRSSEIERRAARRGRGAAASAGTSSISATASRPTCRSRPSPRWSRPCGARDDAAPRRRRRAQPAARPHRAQPGRPRLARGRRAVPAPAVRRPRRHPARLGCVRCRGCWPGRSPGAAAPLARAAYAQIGGRSPIRAETTAQAEAVAAALGRARHRRHARSSPWRPGTRSPTRRWPTLRARGVRRAVAAAALSPTSRAPRPARRSTSSSTRAPSGTAASRSPRSDATRTPPATCERRRRADRGGGGHASRASCATSAPVLFSAHGLPEAYIRRGDPYLDDIRTTVAAVTRRLGLGRAGAPLLSEPRRPPALARPHHRGGAGRAGRRGHTRGASSCRSRSPASTSRRCRRSTSSTRSGPRPPASSTSPAPAPWACHPAFIARARRSGRGDRPRAGLGVHDVRVAIVGGGISGLTAAHVALGRGHDVVLRRRRPRARRPDRAAPGATASSASAGRRRCSTAPKRPAR